MRESQFSSPIPWAANAVLSIGLAVSLSACAGPVMPGGGDPPQRPTVSITPASTSAAKLLPAQGAYLGMFYGSGSVADTNAAVGAVPKIRLTYFDWSDDWVAAATTRQDFAAGRIPMVNWEPFDVDFRSIVNGEYDKLIRDRASAAARLPGQFFLDFAAEMNEEEGWGGHDPAKYVSAWRHIHDIFVERGANNVVWVWAPNNTDSEDAPPALDYYPGADYVDWTGIDGYNWGTSDPDFDWESFGDVFGPMYRQLQTLGKPMMIGETASDEAGGSKSKWIADIVPQLQSRFTGIRALVWFDVDKERHWQVKSSSSSLQAFHNMAVNPYLRQ